MDQEELIQNISETVNYLKDNMAMKEDVKKIDQEIVVIKDNMGRLEGNMEKLEGNMATKGDITRLEGNMEKLEGNMATKGDITRLEGNMDTARKDIQKLKEITEVLQDSMGLIKDTAATKDDLKEMKNELLNHIDGFAKKQRDIESEVAGLHHKYYRLEEKLGINI